MLLLFLFRTPLLLDSRLELTAHRVLSPGYLANVPAAYLSSLYLYSFSLILSYACLSVCINGLLYLYLDWRGALFHSIVCYTSCQSFFTCSCYLRIYVIGSGLFTILGFALESLFAQGFRTISAS